MTSWKAVAATAGLGIALAACGTTVSSSSAPTAADGLAIPGQEMGTALPSADASSGPVALGGASAGVTAGSGSASVIPGGGRTAARAASAGGAPLTSPAADGPGVTPTTLTIGVAYYQSAKAANEALGAKNIDTGDPVAGTRALISAVNKAGGIAGRRVVPLFYAIDPQSSTPYATEAQAECTYFTEDHEVFAVINGAPAADARACLAKHGVAVLSSALVSAEIQANEVGPYTARLDRVFAALVPSLVEQGWFTPWNRVTAGGGTTRAKVGIVTVDSPPVNRAVDGVLLPALRRAGYAPADGDVIRIRPPGGFADDGATVAAIDNAALKLNADGVDHVILNDANGSLTLLFTNYAYSQNYFPRYGGTTGNAWQVLMQAGNIQPKTLRGAMGIGWQPLFDVPYDGREGAFSNAARRHCFAVFTRSGQPRSDAASAGGQAEGCDVTFLLSAALQDYSGPLNLDTLMQRVDALGTSYALASGFSSRFAADQHDGTESFRRVHFDGECQCVVYGSRLETMPH